MEEVIFVYAKDEQIKCYTLSEAKNIESGLLEDGWVHTRTLNACTFLEYLHNECLGLDVIKEIEQLKWKR